MPRVYTIDGPRVRRKKSRAPKARLGGEGCKLVKMGGKGNRGCTIEGCFKGGRFKFQKGTRDCR